MSRVDELSDERLIQLLTQRDRDRTHMPEAVRVQPALLTEAVRRAEERRHNKRLNRRAERR